jgi:hypothetical protein
MTRFYEEQRSVRNMVWLIAMLAPALMLGVAAYQASTGKYVGEHPMSNRSLLVLSVIYLIPVTWVLFFVKFTTEITGDRIRFGWNVPNKELNEILFSDIREWHVIRYRFVGYGYRLTKLYGIVYNVSGDMGLQIVQKNGNKVLIGTQRAAELKGVVEGMLNKTE